MRDGVVQIPCHEHLRVIRPGDAGFVAKMVRCYAAVAAAIKDWITARDDGEGRIVPECPAPRLFIAIDFKYG
jgi:hypothetical protein